MRRFFIDACLLLVLICMGAYVRDRTLNTSVSISNTTAIEQQIEQFEEDVATHQVLEQSTTQNEQAENRAARLAEKGSNFVVNVIGGTADFVFLLFDEIIK